MSVGFLPFTYTAQHFSSFMCTCLLYYISDKMPYIHVYTPVHIYYVAMVMGGAVYVYIQFQ